MDLQIREFSNAIINFINSSPLPAEIKKLALADIFAQTCKEADRVVREQIVQRETQKAESEVSDNGTATEDIQQN